MPAIQLQTERPASTQLQGYAADDKADGYGIYLVFWFGNDYKLPPRPDRSARPDSAEALEKMLIADLPPELRSRTDVIVFDVSKNLSDAPARPRKKKAAAKRAPRKTLRGQS